MGARSVEVEASSQSFLSQQKPVGWQGGRTIFLGVGVEYDRRDLPIYPTKGFIHELVYELHSPWWGSDFSFWRLTYQYRSYSSFPSPSLVWAGRFLGEVLEGSSLPFFALEKVGGFRPSFSIGYDEFLRGYVENEFVGLKRFFLSLEWRWIFVRGYVRGRTLEMALVQFFDGGYVGNEWFDFSRLHFSTGMGFRAIWNRRLLVRLDIAQTPSRHLVVVQIGNSF